MICEAIKRLKTDSRTLRKFGVAVGTVLLLLGGLFLWRHQPVAPLVLGAGGLLFVLGVAAPRCLKHIYLVWMSLGLLIGTVVSTLLLVVFFYLVVTPVGLLARCLGKDLLQQKLYPELASYWQNRDPAKARPPQDYERQF